MNHRVRELDVHGGRERIDVEEIAAVVARDGHREPDILDAETLEAKERPQRVIEAVRDAPKLVVRRGEPLDAHADRDPREAARDRLDLLVEEPVRRYFEALRFRVEDLDDAHDILSQKRLAAGDVEAFHPARELAQDIGIELLCGFRGILPAAAHAAARVAAVGRYYGAFHRMTVDGFRARIGRKRRKNPCSTKQ